MRTTGLFCTALIGCLFACEQSSPSLPPVVTSVAPAAKSPPKIARIIFIDQEEACECTRKRIEEAWAVLQEVLGDPPKLPVERFHADTQPAQAALYTAAKPLMVPPGIYFLDMHEEVIDMLQGEVTAKQIAAALKGR